MEAIDILKNHKINRTPSREKIVNIIQQKGPLTQNELKKLADFRLNRITIFRCLRLFINKGIIVRLQDHDGVQKYFLNNEKQTDYVHFKCSRCNIISPV